MIADRQGAWYEHASRALHDAGYRRGAARHAVLAVLDSQACACSAIEIEEKLRHDGPPTRTVSRASVYRVLAELEGLGLVARLEVGQGIVRFEAVREGSGHHHHLICDGCGTLTPFTDDELERAIRHVSERVAMNVSEHEVVLHGACADCTPPR
jgi:Fur family ferric uptake transcriptional regulator